MSAGRPGTVLPGVLEGEEANRFAAVPSGLAEAETKLGEAEARVETLTRQVFLTMPAEQREIQARIAQARSGRDRTGLEEAGSALNTAKRQRNACIDELAAAKSAVAER